MHKWSEFIKMNQTENKKIVKNRYTEVKTEYIGEASTYFKKATQKITDAINEEFKDKFFGETSKLQVIFHQGKHNSMWIEYIDSNRKNGISMNIMSNIIKALNSIEVNAGNLFADGEGFSIQIHLNDFVLDNYKINELIKK